MRWLAVIILICWSFAAAGLARQQCELNITSTPSGCWVRIDSVLIGKTPLTRFTTLPGAHVIEIYPPQSGIWNLQEQVYRVKVAAGESAAVHANFSAPVYINSIPFGALLFADSVKLGSTPLYLPYEENRGREMTLRKKGFKEYRFVLNSSRSILARLEKDASYVEEEPRPRLLGILPQRNVRSKFALLTATVATHWVSFYFKNVADHNYSKYSRNADPVQRDKFWNRTRKYDRLSEITLGVSYASLAGLVYLVVWK